MSCRRGRSVRPEPETGGLSVNAATQRYPSVVLGSQAAEQLGVHEAGPGFQVWLGDRWFTVVGLLATNELAPELDSAALVGWPVAEEELGFDGYATTIYTRAEEAHVADVQQVLGATANPENPNEVDVSRPSDALAAQQATDAACPDSCSACAARWAPPGARSAPSSCASRCCCPPSAGLPTSHWASR